MVANQQTASVSTGHPVPGWLNVLLIVTLVLSILTVSVSAYIRLVESGLGCDGWPDCYGYYHNKESAQGINVLLEKGQQSPHRFARVTHRLVATVLGGVILFLFVVTLRKPEYGIHKKASVLLFVLTMILASIGGIHPDNPLPLLMLANFLGGLMLVALSYFLYLDINQTQKKSVVTPFAPWIRLGLFLVALQISMGGWTSANFAAPGCKGLFECDYSQREVQTNHESVLSIDALELDENGRVVIGERMQSIQFLHHVTAIFSLIYFILLTVFLIRRERKLQNVCITVVALIIFQCLLGLIALQFQLPLNVIVLHNLFSAFLVMAITLLNVKTNARVSL